MKEISYGKIQNIELVDKEGRFGFSVTIGGGGWGVSDFFGTWSTHDEYCKWTVEEQHRVFLESLLKIKSIMSSAKVDKFSMLKDKPIVAEFDGNKLVSWRIFDEVL